MVSAAKKAPGAWDSMRPGFLGNEGIGSFNGVVVKASVISFFVVKSVPSPKFTTLTTDNREQSE